MNLFNPTKRTELRARLNRLTPESKPLWCKMSVGEMLCHCLDGNKISLGKIPATDQSNFFTRSFVKYSYLISLTTNLFEQATSATIIYRLEEKHFYIE